MKATYKILTSPKMKLLLVFVLISILGIAQSEITQPQYYIHKMGNLEVIALSDGTVPVSATKLFHEANANDIRARLKKAYLTDTVEVSINSFLVKIEDKIILIDAGSGDLFGPAYGGKLVKSLNDAGFKPGDITDILITHIHLDHSGGLVRNDTIIFPNATIHVNEKEIEFWNRHLFPNKKDSRGIKDNRPAFLVVKQYLDKGMIKSFKGGQTLFQGLKTLEFAGHTSGHTVFELESSGERMLFWGDLVHIASIQLEGPMIADEFDFDQNRSAAQRLKAYNDAANQGYLIAAAHISFPGIGRVRKEGKMFTWIPSPYSIIRIR